MANILRQPFLNPIQVFNRNFVPLPQYQSKHMDDYPFKDTVREWQQPSDYLTRWLKDDPIRIQYTSNFEPITYKIYRCEDGAEILSNSFATKQQDFFNPDFYIRQVEIGLTAFAYGFYELRIIANTLILGKEYFEVCAELPDTLLLEYSHYEQKGGIKFDVPFAPCLRLPASIPYKKTPSKSSVYEDQSYNETIIKSVPYRIHEFILGGATGVPPWLIDKVARIFGCSDLRIDGRYYTKAGEGAEFEANQIQDYPLAGWKIDMQPKLNKDGLTYQDDIVIVGKNSMQAVVSNKGFGVDNEDYDTILEIT